MLREIEEAVAFVSAYLYFRLPRPQVDQFALRLATTILSTYRQLKRVGAFGDDGLKEILLEINYRNRMALAIADAATIFNVPINEISALLPGSVELHIREGAVTYSEHDKHVCLYRADGNMLHLHRRAHHTRLRPPLTVTGHTDPELRVFELIKTDTFPRTEQPLGGGCDEAGAGSALLTTRNDQNLLPGPPRLGDAVVRHESPSSSCHPQSNQATTSKGDRSRTQPGGKGAAPKKSSWNWSPPPSSPFSKPPYAKDAGRFAAAAAPSAKDACPLQKREQARESPSGKTETTNTTTTAESPITSDPSDSFRG